jgi:phage terminase Nu1 subunit (DNA packaging protein)
MGEILNYGELCERYGVKRATLRNYISLYDFPVVSRGVAGEGWQFDTDQVDAWRSRTGLLGTKRGPRRHDPRQMRLPTTVPGAAAEEQEQSTLNLPPVRETDRKAKIQADLLQLELDEKSGRMVEREAVAALFSAKFARFAKRLDMIPTLVARKMGLAPEVERELRDHLDEARTALVRDDDGYFTAPGAA